MIQKEGHPLMPHDILVLLLCYVENSPLEQTQGIANTWQMVAQWCIMAAQKDPQGDSLVAFAIEAITKTDDAYFDQWVKSCLDGTMGTRPVNSPHPGVPMAGTSAQVPGHFAADLGKGVALGLQALGPFKPLTGSQGGVTEADSKQMYGEEDIAALMGFSHIRKESDLQDIWMYFQSLQGENLDVCHRQLMARMNWLSHDHRIPIDRSMYLKGTTIKAIMELKFNPGEGVVHLSSSDKGLSIMVCCARTSAEMERIRERKEALSATETTRQLDELLRLSKGVTRAPADNFWELKMNITMFMSLVWVLL
jgi:hypothetical protein